MFYHAAKQDWPSVKSIHSQAHSRKKNPQHSAGTDVMGMHRALRFPRSQNRGQNPRINHKNGFCCSTRNITELITFWQKLCFSGERGAFIWYLGENSWWVVQAWTTRTSLHKHSHPLPKQCKHVEATAQVSKKTTKPKIQSWAVSKRVRHVNKSSSWERQTNKSEMDCSVCSHVFCFYLKRCKACYNKIYALFCLFEALIGATRSF